MGLVEIPGKRDVFRRRGKRADTEGSELFGLFFFFLKGKKMWMHIFGRVLCVF